MPALQEQRGLAAHRPGGQGVASVRPLCDEIRSRIEELIAGIAPATGAQ